MKTFSRTDDVFAIITGLTTGFIGWLILAYLGIARVAGIPAVALVFVIPCLWVAGVRLGYLLGRWLPFFNQFGKFTAVGFANAAVDFGVLYAFIAYSDIAQGFYYTIFKTVSFFVALLHSYFWNSTWTFANGDETRWNGREFLTFAYVAFMALLVNVGVASLVVNYIEGSYFGFTPRAWAGIGAVVGSASALIFSFLGFKFVVFKK